MASISLDVLAGIDGVTLTERAGGAVVDVATRAGHAAIALQGAQVLYWHPAGQTHDVLWLSPAARFGGGKPIRGGVPICWPWFGPRPGQPQHGYARTALWSIVGARRAGDDVELVFELPPADADPQAANARLRFAVVFGSTLDMRLETTNVGTEPMSLTHALHTYLRVGDVGRISIEGLDGATYRDNTDNGTMKQQRGVMSIPRETVALFDDAAARHVLDDPVLRRRIVVTRTFGRSTIVWNPGASAAGMGDVPPPSQTEFVCIESGSIGEAADLLAPGATAGIGQRLEVTAA